MDLYAAEPWGAAEEETMPAKKPTRGRAPASVRRPRCTYHEGGRRCVKDGDGNPPLCRPHQLAVAAILNNQIRTPAQRVVDLVGDFLSGKRVNEADIMGVAQDVAAQWSGMADGFRPPIDRNGRTAHGSAPQWSPAEWREFLRSQTGGGARQAPPPPPVDQEEEDNRIARLRARQVLGFTASQVLTIADVKGRHRALAKRNHPDRGGSTAKMATINNAADVLLADPEIR